MALAHLGVTRRQEDLGRLLGTNSEAGTPGFRLVLLQSSKLSVEYREGDWDFLIAMLAQRIPVITLVSTAE